MQEAHRRCVPEDVPGCTRCYREENKADDLMPQRMDGLHGGGKNVLHELACVLRKMFVGHDSMLTNVKLVPESAGLYNQGNSCMYSVSYDNGTDGPALASVE
jgi:hypothetical protein